MEVAAGDVGTAWCLCLASAHALHLATLFGEQAQAELFGDGDFRCPAVAAPAGQAVRTDDGWELNGTWGYCSGAPYATHYMGQTFEAPAQPGGPPGQMLLFVVPAARVDDARRLGQHAGAARQRLALDPHGGRARAGAPRAREPVARRHRHDHARRVCASTATRCMPGARSASSSPS